MLRGIDSFFRYLVISAVLLIGVFPPVLAQSNMVSDYVPFFGTYANTDYKTMYHPTTGGWTYIKGDEITLSASGSNFNRYMNSGFIPPGTRRLQMTFGTYGNGETKVVVGYGIPPSLGVNEVTEVTAGKIDSKNVLLTLLDPVYARGVPFYAPSTTSVVLMSLPSLYDITNKTTVGKWIYSRVLELTDEIVSSSTDKNIAGFSITVTVDRKCYESWYSRAVRENWFDASGNPIQTGSDGQPFVHHVKEEDKAYCGDTTPETGPTIPTPSSFSIALGNTTLTQGVTSTIGITPNATLSSCSASSVAGAPSYSNNTITLTPSSTATSVTVTCTSTTGGTATATLPVQAAPTTTTAFSSFTLSPSSLLKTDTATLITVKPNTGAVVPASTVCQVMQSQKYLVPAGTNQWKINPDANVQQIAQSLTIDCGSDASGKAITSNFTITMPLVNNPTGSALEFNFPSGNATTADLYIAGYIPNILKNKLTGNVESAWICRSNDDSSWVYMPGAVLPRICKRSGINANDKVRITIDAADVAGIGNSSISEYFFTFSEKTLKDAKVELYGAYTTDNGNTFKFIGDDTTGIFLGKPNALYRFK